MTRGGGIVDARRRQGYNGATTTSRIVNLDDARRSVDIIRSDDDEDSYDEWEREEERMLSDRHGEASEDNKDIPDFNPDLHKRKHNAGKEDADQIAQELEQESNKRRRIARPKLTAQDLLEADYGLIRIPHEFKEIKYTISKTKKNKKKTSANDIILASANYSSALVNQYRNFCYDLFPDWAMEDVLHKIEQLGAKPNVKAFIQQMRDNVRNRHIEEIYGPTKAQAMIDELQQGLYEQQQQLAANSNSNPMYDHEELDGQLEQLEQEEQGEAEEKAQEEEQHLKESDENTNTDNEGQQAEEPHNNNNDTTNQNTNPRTPKNSFANNPYQRKNPYSTSTNNTTTAAIVTPKAQTTTTTDPNEKSSHHRVAVVTPTTANDTSPTIPNENEEMGADKEDTNNMGDETVKTNEKNDTDSAPIMNDNENSGTENSTDKDNEKDDNNNTENAATKDDNEDSGIEKTTGKKISSNHQQQEEDNEEEEEWEETSQIITNKSTKQTEEEASISEKSTKHTAASSSTPAKDETNPITSNDSKDVVNQGKQNDKIMITNSNTGTAGETVVGAGEPKETNDNVSETSTNNNIAEKEEECNDGGGKDTTTTTNEHNVNQQDHSDATATDNDPEDDPDQAEEEKQLLEDEDDSLLLSTDAASNTKQS